MIDYETVQSLTDTQLAEARAELQSVVDVVDYERLRRKPVREMTPDEMARACDLARGRIAATDDPLTVAVLHAFIRDVELVGREKFVGRRVTGRLDVGINQIFSQVLGS
jgi:hypothetical protein